MNGLRAFPGGRIASSVPLLQSLGVSNRLNHDDVLRHDSSGDEAESLEGLADDEADARMEYHHNVPTTAERQLNDGPETNGHTQEEDAPIMDRDVVPFFERFLPRCSDRTPLEPITVLQSKYNILQHQIDKQAQQQSIKGWFRDTKINELWWSAEITTPPDMASMWGLAESSAVRRASGRLRLSPSEMRMLEEGGRRGGTGDILRDLCGEYRASSDTNAVQFKSKKGARKSAALNLLLAIDLGDVMPENGMESNAFLAEDGRALPNGLSSSIPKGRFQFDSIRYYGAVKDPDGKVLSCANPCMLQCRIAVKDDASLNNTNQDALIKVTSDFHLCETDSLKDALDRLRHVLVNRGATANEVLGVLSAARESKPNVVSYEMRFPKWATASLSSRLYLYELEFSIRKNGVRAPLFEMMGLDAEVATRIGIVCGCDLYGEHGTKCLEKVLCGDFRIGPSAVSVKMHSRTEVTPTEMSQQIERAIQKISLGEGEDPISLAKCFNVILFDHGTNYGASKWAWEDLMAKLEVCEAETVNQRTYLFLPLQKRDTTHLEIDWNQVYNVVHRQNVCVSTGVWFPTSLSYRILLGASVATIIACRICINGGNDTGLKYVAEALIALSLWTASSTTKRIPTSLLQNHFLCQPIGLGKRLFIPTNEGHSSMLDLIPLLWDLLKVELLNYLCNHPSRNAKYIKKIWQRYFKHPVDPLIPATSLNHRSNNAKYIEKIWRCYFKHPMDPLIPAISLSGPGVSYKHHEAALSHRMYGESFSTPISKPSSRGPASIRLAARGLLVPEHTQLLPMPRDMLYLISNHAPDFMQKLERSHTLLMCAARLTNMQRSSSLLLHPLAGSTDWTASLLEKATSICTNVDAKDPVHNERLETLGDSVLLYFIVLNLFAKQPTNNEYVLDLFESVISLQGRNEVLFGAARAVGLHRLVRVGNMSPTALWKSIFKTSPTVPSTRFSQTMNLSTKQLSDMLESVIGATYLIDPTGGTTLGLLNEVGPCLPNVQEDSTCFADWFAGKGTCLVEPYPFLSHSEWAAELKRIEGILQLKHDIHSILRRKGESCFQLLTRGGRRNLQMNSAGSLLMQCALFDDSLEEEELHPEATDGLECLCKLRDAVFHIGNAALQLSIVSEMYHLYPASTSGDLHLMKVVMMSHDTLAYIFVKNGFSDCLFDSDADTIALMKDYMKDSDLLGAKEWATKNGWVVPGGVDEYRRRVEQYHRSGGGDDDCCSRERVHPQYTGLAAGRLRGQQKKLEDAASDDLQFSMKCIAGALALTCGVKEMWSVLRPFFLELMLLSPDELREYYGGVSDLASNYRKGRK